MRWCVRGDGERCYHGGSGEEALVRDVGDRAFLRGCY